MSWEGYFHPSETSNQICLKTILFQGRRNLSFKDKYAFDTMQKWQQFFTDTIPGMIAGKGMPYFIFGSFTDTISDSFTLVCDCDHEEKIY